MSELHHELVAPADASPRAWLLMTHGIFGSGGNWRTIARRLLARRSGWGAVLVDLRGHGRSPAGAPPHTVEACGADLARLAAALGEAGRPVRAALGHSFGGKCVLAQRALGRHPAGGAPAAGTARRTELLQTWVLDASPSRRPDVLGEPAGSVRRVLELLERGPARYARREDLVAAAVADGHGEGLGRWLATSLEPVADGFRLRLELPVVRALLEDYAAADLWPAVEDPAMPGELHVVVAGRSQTVSHDDRARLAAHGARTGLTSVHLVAEAGHWLHVDSPDAVVELLAGALPEA